MIIEELGKFVIIDEIRHNATGNELYFLSCLLGYEMLSLSEDWPGRIYTSQFIYDVLLKKKPKVNPKCFRVLKADVPTKFKSKDKVVWVTMFESEEIKNSVMFYFDDSINKYLYTGTYSEISSCYRNEKFMSVIQKGIDYVYIDSVLCNSNPYICTEDTIDEIRTIYLKHSGSKLAVIIPNFGYEKLLVELVQAFPQSVYPTKTQRYILTKLGYTGYLSSNCQSGEIIILTPGIFTECFETELIVIYITVGDASTLGNEYGVYLRQWSPLPSLMNQQVLLEMIRPNYIVPIEQHGFEESVDLPFNIRSLAKKMSDQKIETEDTTDTETWPENNSIRSIESISSTATGIQNDEPPPAVPSTKFVCHPQAQSTKNSITEKSTDLEEEKETSSRYNENTKLPSSVSTKNPITENLKNVGKEDEESSRNKKNTKFPTNVMCTNLTKQRTRVFRKRSDINFSDSDDD